MYTRLLVFANAPKYFRISASTWPSVLSRSPLPGQPSPHTEPPPPNYSSYDDTMPMEAMMFKEFHDLCMSGTVPEAGILMSGPSEGTLQHWIYCSQGQSLPETASENLPSSSSQNYPAVSIAEPAPVEQMHRIILNKKRVTGSDAPKPPTVYVMPPKIRNQYTVDLIHEEDQYNKNNSSHSRQYLAQPTEPVIYFLNGENNPQIPENDNQHSLTTTLEPKYYANRAHPGHQEERKNIIENYSKIRA